MNEADVKKTNVNTDKINLLKQKYGVMKEIPEQKIDSKVVSEEMKEERKVQQINILDLLLRLEKMEGKFSFVEDFKDDVNERLAHLSEEIGELRSSFLEMDKNFSSLETKAEKALEIISEMQPEKISKEFQKKDAEIMKIQAEIETIKSILTSVKNEGEKLNKVLERVKSIENVVSMFKRLEEKIKIVDEAKDYVDRLAGKSESIFSELGSKVEEIENLKEKVAKIDDLTVDIVKMLDGISIKIPKFIEKENAEKILRDAVKEEIKKNYSVDVKGLSEINNAVNGIKNILSKEMNILTALNEKVELYFNFLQSINNLIYSTNVDDVKSTILKIKATISEMKKNGTWNERSINLLMKVFESLKNMWDYYQQKEIKEIFESELESIKSLA